MRWSVCAVIDTVYKGFTYIDEQSTSAGSLLSVEKFIVQSIVTILLISLADSYSNLKQLFSYTLSVMY